MGAWIETTAHFTQVRDISVAPHVGAWIETTYYVLCKGDFMSHPTWVRGLKLSGGYFEGNKPNVAPHVGAWIETR